MDMLLALAAGVCLAAAAGMRVFVPLLVLSAAAQFADLPLSAGFAWLDSPVTLGVLAAATVVEILGYFIPWVDNALDAIAGPLAVIAGILAVAAVAADLPPILRWIVAILVGGGASGAVQTGTTLVRGASSATTGGIANPAVATAELGGSIVTSILALVLPLLGLVLVIALLVFVTRRLARLRRADRSVP